MRRLEIIPALRNQIYPIPLKGTNPSLEGNIPPLGLLSLPDLGIEAKHKPIKSAAFAFKHGILHS